LENLYCIILDKEIDQKNFRKDVKLQIIEETNQFSIKTGRQANYSDLIL
jgi:hypothetical protein